MAKFIVLSLLIAQSFASELSQGAHETLIRNMLMGGKPASRPVMAWSNNAGERHTKAELSMLQRKGAPTDTASVDITDSANSVDIFADDVTDEKKDTTTLELTRFVTPYRVGMDKFVDITKFAPLFDKAMNPVAGETEHKMVLHKIANCTQCGIDWCNAGFELEEVNVEAKAHKIGERLSKWTCGKLHAGPVRKPWKNSETGAMYVAEATPVLTMYGMIDTWVSSSDPKKLQYYQKNYNVTGKVDDKCHEMQTDDGQGWVLEADLVFIHGKQDQAVKPKEVVSLASGYFSTHTIGQITDHKASVTFFDKKVHLEKPMELTGMTEAVVYQCREGPGKVLENAVANYIARQSEIDWKAEGKNIEGMRSEFEEYLAQGELVNLMPLREKEVLFEGTTFVAAYDPSKMKPEIGMPAFYQNVVTEGFLEDMNGNKKPWNMSFPFKPAGEVIFIAPGVNEIIVKMDHQCVPKWNKNVGLKVAIPSSVKAFDKIKQFVADAMDLGKIQASVEVGDSPTESDQRLVLPSQDRLGQLKLPRPNPYVPNDNAIVGAVPVPASGHPIIQQIFEFDNDQDRHDAPAGDVCVVAQRKHGEIIRKRFNLPMREAGDRVLANIAVTGHGWSYTQDQCGEYCDVLYSLKFNNGKAINLTQWRDDCKNNPIQSFGTYDESRNGWCPGTVEPGAVVDITHLLTDLSAEEISPDGLEQTVTLDILTYSKDTKRYEPFSNVRGWIFGDQSILKVELSLHVYDAKAYETAKNKFISCTSIESAMNKKGSVIGDAVAGEPGDGEPSNAAWNTVNTAAFMRKSSESVGHSSRVKRDMTIVGGETQGPDHPPLHVHENPWSEGASCWQFKRTAPWYGTHWGGLSQLIEKDMATVVPVIQKVYFESGSRYQTIPVFLDAIKGKEFSQIGLIVKLGKPDGGEYDHWDRVGSVGLEFQKTTQIAKVHSKSDEKPEPLDNTLVDAQYRKSGAQTITAISSLLIALLAFYA